MLVWYDWTSEPVEKTTYSGCRGLTERRSCLYNDRRAFAIDLENSKTPYPTKTH